MWRIPTRGTPSKLTTSTLRVMISNMSGTCLNSTRCFSHSATIRMTRAWSSPGFVRTSSSIPPPSRSAGSRSSSPATGEMIREEEPFSPGHLTKPAISHSRFGFLRTCRASRAAVSPVPTRRSFRFPVDLR